MTKKSNLIKEDIVESLKDCKYTKQQIIDKLVEVDVEDIKYSEDFVSDMLRDGWKGYNNCTLEELKGEYNRRHDEQI